MNDNTPQKTNIKPYLIIALLGFIVAWQSWKAGEALGDSFIFKLGVLFALGGLFIAVNGIRRARAGRKPALPAAPAEFNGAFAPDFRRNLGKLHEALGPDSPEMTLEADYAFWYNTDQSIELVLSDRGWLAFFLLHDGELNLEAPLVQRAVADYKYRPSLWRVLVQNGMRGDYSWDVSAVRYLELYNQLCQPVSE